MLGKSLWLGALMTVGGEANQQGGECVSKTQTTDQQEDNAGSI